MKGSSWFFLIPMMLFLVLFYWLPLGNMLAFSLSLPLNKWVELTLGSQLFIQFFQFTFTQAILSTLFSAVIGTTTAYLIANWKSYFMRILSPALTVPFLLPPISILIGFVIIFEPGGVISGAFNLFGFNFSIFSNPWAIILAHTLYNISVYVKIMLTYFNTEPEGMNLILESFDGRWSDRLRYVLLPHIKTGFLSATLLVFLYSFNSFAIVLLLGEVKYQTLEVMIYTQTRVRFDFATGSIIAMLQLVFNILIIWLYLQLENRQKNKISGSSFHITSPNNLKRVSSTIFTILITLFTWTPILATFYQFTRLFEQANPVLKEKLISGSYENLLGTSPMQVLINTLFFAIASATVTLLFSVLYILYLQTNKHPRFQKIINLTTILPIATSGVTLGFGFILFYSPYIDLNSYVWVFIISAHLLAELPFVIRIIASSWEYIDTKFMIVARTLDASNWEIFRWISFPILRKSFAVGFIFALAISIGEFGSTYYLVTGRWMTVAAAIGRLFSSRTALLPVFYASILSILGFVLFFVAEQTTSIELKV